MTILEIMQKRYPDGVYNAAISSDPEATHAAIARVNQPVDPLLASAAKSIRYGRTEEEEDADYLHGVLEDIVIQAFVRQYDREEMSMLLRALGRWNHYAKVELCEGLAVSLESLSEKWSGVHHAEKIYFLDEESFFTN